ncbi:hypothetical protein BX265_0816 [Streptomyces sp. TLI_235]|nr:WD40 repeat domain-containing protein [Streptomyces sp. TLI_235]PBC76115.1 hypothetical protein BX265_0816 [Streptomyces sp. TLI_235]
MERATRSGRRTRGGAAAAGALLILLGPAALPAAAAERPERAFTIHDKRITESSGLAASRAHPGVYWTHNDSDDGPYVYAVDSEGRTVATVTLRGVKPRDVEAISLGPDGRLYVGDVGDNLDGTWPEVWIYAFPEPAELRDQTVSAVRYKVRYEDGPRDAEALMVHPVTGRAYIASKKQSGGGLYRGPEALSPTGVNTFRRIADVPWVTDGAFSPDGGRLVLRGYFDADLYSWDGAPKKLRSLDVPFQRQGESVTFSADGSAVLYGSEGAESDVWRLRLNGDRAPEPSGAASAAPSGGARTPSDRAAAGSGSDGGSNHALAALIAVAAALGLAKLWSGRRKAN